MPFANLDRMLFAPGRKLFSVVIVIVYKVEKAKIRNRYNQVPHLTPNIILENDKTQENIFVSYKQKYVHKVLVNHLVKLAQEKVWLSKVTVQT